MKPFFCGATKPKMFNMVVPVHSRFKGLVNFGAPSMENSFQFRKTSSLFCLVQNGPKVTWVACIGLRERSKWSLRCARDVLEAFLKTFSNTWDTQSQEAACIKFQTNMEKLWIIDYGLCFFFKQHGPHGPLIVMI